MTSKVPIVISIAFAAMFFTPLVILFLTGTTWSAVVRAFADPHAVDALWSTLYPSAIGAGFAVLLGGTYSWLVFRTNLPGKKILAVLPFLELALPKEVKALGFEFLLGPRIGLFNILFKSMFHVNFPLFDINSNAGLALAGAAGGMPFAYITITAAIRGLDSSLEDSARVTGSSIMNTLRRVTIPLISPAVVTAFILDFIIISATFDYAFIFGAQASSGVNTLATAIYDNVVDAVPPDYPGAAALSLYYILITVVAMSVYLWYTKRSFKFVTVVGQNVRPTLYALYGWKKYAGLLVCALIIWLTFFMLAFIIILVSLFPLFNTQDLMGTLSQVTLANYEALFFSTDYSLFWTALRNSLTVAAVTAVATAFFATFLSYAALKSRVRGAKVLEYFNTLPFATPGIVWSLAFLWMFLSIPFISKFLYGTIWALMIALLVAWLPFSVRIVSGTVIQVSNDMEEAASVAGAKWTRIYRTVLLPIFKVGVLVSFVYVFIDTFRELGDVALLTTPDSYVLTKFIADLYTQTAASYPVAAAVSTVMIVVMLVFIIGANYLLGGILLSSERA